MFSVEEILKASGGQLIKGNAGKRVSGVSTDSRVIGPGELFIPLEGRNFDGHNFIKDCLQKGAAGVIVKKGKLNSAFEATISDGQFIIEAGDTLKSLGGIAHFHRARFSIPVIGITGSNGKTTTKDMTAQVLGIKYNVLKNEGTLNNIIGVPLTLLKLNCQHQVCILEMGANHLNEIAALAEIARPNIGVITNIGPSHLEFFKDIETVSRAKIELFENFTRDDTAVWNADDIVLSRLCHALNSRKRTFGASVSCDFQASKIEYFGAGWRFTVNGAVKPAAIKLLARHNVYNALAAIAIADLFGIEYALMTPALANFKPPYMRMQVIQAGGVTIINDAYNSNPKSMESAISALSNFKAKGRKIIVSGDMLELGEISSYFHSQLGVNIANSGIDIFIAVGEMSKEAVDAALRSGMNKDSVCLCDDAGAAGNLLLKILRGGDVVLIKGSRGMKMEKVCSIVYSIR